jgi:hypothetical protein
MTGGGGGNASRNTPERLCRGNLVRAAIDRAADPEPMRLDQVVKAESDAAVLANPNSRDCIVSLRALEAVHRKPPQADRQSQINDHRGRLNRHPV